MAGDLMLPDPGEFLFYQTEDGRTRLQVRMEGETVWLSQRAMADLFQKDVRTVSEHIRHVFEEGELQSGSVVRNFRITAADNKQYDTQHYSLDVIISVGYRVKSLRGTQFRISDREILTHAGAISHEMAKLKAEAEYESFRAGQAGLPQPVDRHFAEAIEVLGGIEGGGEGGEAGGWRRRRREGGWKWRVRAW